MNLRLLKNKKVVIAIVIFVLLSIIMVVIAILNFQKKNSHESKPRTDWDPASQTEITTFTGYTSPKGERTIYVGFDSFQHGTDYDVYTQFIQATKKLAIIQKIDEYERISVYKDTLKRQRIDGKWQTTFKIALNKDKGDVFVRIIKSSYYKYSIGFYEDQDYKKEILKHDYCDPAVCQDEIQVF